MIEVNGKKLSQRDVDDLLIQACRTHDLKKVTLCVENYGANVNTKDHGGYASVLVYALRACHKQDQESELIVAYLVQHGANINDRHGTKLSHMDSRQSILYYAATNVDDISDKLVEYLVKHSNLETLNYSPSTKVSKPYASSAIEEIKNKRPQLYQKLLKGKLVPSEETRR